MNRPKILLLAEATSAFDAVTESLISQNLRKLECTQIIIAHRLSTIMNSDVIYVLDHGQILDSGTHYELMSRCEYYMNLVSNQVQDNRTSLSY